MPKSKSKRKIDPNKPKVPKAKPSKKQVLFLGLSSAIDNHLYAAFRTEEWQVTKYDPDKRVNPDVVGPITDLSALPEDHYDAIWCPHVLERLYPHDMEKMFYCSQARDERRCVCAVFSA